MTPVRERSAKGNVKDEQELGAVKNSSCHAMEVVFITASYRSWFGEHS